MVYGFKFGFDEFPFAIILGIEFVFIENSVDDRSLGTEFWDLLEKRKDCVFGTNDFSGFGFHLSGRHLEEGGFSRPVWSHNGNTSSRFDMPAESLKEDFGAEVLVDLDELDQGL